jgi:hypothetical protein
MAEAIHEDSIARTQISDLQFWNNKVAKQYGIQSISQNLLPDFEGKIIAKNISSQEPELKTREATEGKKGFRISNRRTRISE